MAFVDEVMELVELDNLGDALVGLPGVTGLSIEQRKRLTIWSLLQIHLLFSWMNQLQDSMPDQELLSL